MLTTLMILALAAAGQDPAPPYRVEPLDVTNGEVKLAGTLTVPRSTRAAVPAVVLITGSGPQTRDEDVFGFKVFATLADHLTREGIAVYRYDDRGVGIRALVEAADALRKVTVPVYAAFGTLDTQVPPSMHAGPMRARREGGADLVSCRDALMQETRSDPLAGPPHPASRTPT